MKPSDGTTDGTHIQFVQRIWVGFETGVGGSADHSAALCAFLELSCSCNDEEPMLGDQLWQVSTSIAFFTFAVSHGTCVRTDAV